jgi:hypothetical protein
VIEQEIADVIEEFGLEDTLSPTMEAALPVAAAVEKDLKTKTRCVESPA